MMKRVLNVRSLAAVAALIGIGLMVPAFAVRPLGSADPFGLLSSGDINITGDNSLGVVGDVGAGGVINDPSSNLGPTGSVITGAATAAPLAAAQAGKDRLDALTGVLIGNDLTTNDLGAGPGVYAPGVYNVNGAATITGGITFAGTGGIGDVWVFNIRDSGDPAVPGNRGTLDVSGGVIPSGGGGALPANIYWNTDRGINVAAGNTLAGNAIAGDTTHRDPLIGASVGDVTLGPGAVVMGRVHTVNGAISVSTLGVTVLVADFTSAGLVGPDLVLTPNPAVHVVNPGQLLSVAVSASDPDAANTVTLSAGTLPPGAFFAGALPITGVAGAAVTSNFNWTPGVGQEGNYEIPIFATDSSGLVDFVGMDVRVNSAPTFDGPTPADFSTFSVCPGETVTFSVQASDVDPDQVTITQTGAPSGAVLTNNPNPGNPAVIDFSYTAPLPGGTSDDITFTATDPFGRTDVRTITVEVFTQPVVTATLQSTTAAGTDIADGGTVNVCVGETLNIDVTGSDADPADSLFMEVSGLPLGADQNPNFLGEDNTGTLGGDSLIISGNPITSRLSWTPVVADARTTPYQLTYAVIDLNGCVETHVINVQVSQRPTIAVTLNGLPVANNAVIWACPAPQGPVVFTVDGADGDAGATLTLTGVGTAVPGLSFAPTLPVVGDPGAGVSSTATFAPTADEQGGSFPIALTVSDEIGCSSTINLTLRVSRSPVVDVTGGQVFTMCPGQTVNYQLNVTDADTVGATLRLEADSNPAGLEHTTLLPTSGNPITIGASFTAQSSQEGQTITVTYTATDQFGCTGSATVTFVVEDVITNLTMHQTPAGSGVTGAVNIDEEVCYTVTAKDQCDQPLPGRTILFSVAGGTGNNVTNIARVTDAMGEATYCLTPRFPGTNTVTGGWDANDDGQLDPTEVRVSLTMTVIVPASNIQGRVLGGGSVIVGSNALRNGRRVPANMVFTLNVRGSRTGAARGPMNVNINGSVSELPVLGRNFRATSVLLDAVVTGAVASGRTGIILGEANTNAFGRIRYRVDVLDGSPAGGPNDRFTITFLTPAGPLAIGGALDPGRTRNDVKVVTGISD